MLNAEALVDGGSPVVHVDRHRDDDRALGQQQPVPLVEREVEVVGDNVELVARHGENRSGIERHRGVPCRLGDPAAIASSLCFLGLASDLVKRRGADKP